MAVSALKEFDSYDKKKFPVVHEIQKISLYRPHLGFKMSSRSLKKMRVEDRVRILKDLRSLKGIFNNFKERTLPNVLNEIMFIRKNIDRFQYRLNDGPVNQRMKKLEEEVGKLNK